MKLSIFEYIGKTKSLMFVYKTNLTSYYFVEICHLYYGQTDTGFLPEKKINII